MKSNRFNYPNFGFSSGLGRLIQDAFEGLEDLGGVFANQEGVQACPRADLYEDEHNYHVTLELPGVAKSDVKVEFIDGALKVAATISKETADGRKNFPISRSITLPDQIGDGEIHAKLENGILTITLPKAEAAKPRSIEIQ